MLERLEFDGVAGRVEEEHRGLLARFAFETDVLAHRRDRLVRDI
jgi:hypothetical protein